MRSWGLSGRGAVWGQDGKKNIYFDSLPENQFQNLFSSVSRRWWEAVSKEGRWCISQGGFMGRPGAHLFQDLSKAFRSAPEHFLRAVKFFQNDDWRLSEGDMLGWDYLGGSCKAGSFKAVIMLFKSQFWGRNKMIWVAEAGMRFCWWLFLRLGCGYLGGSIKAGVRQS